MIFMPDQCRTLVTSGTKTQLGLIHCRFTYDGEAFLEALAAREDPETGLAELNIVKCLPFAEGILVLFLHILKCLSLHFIHLESEEACRDGGVALVESFRAGRGPKGLGLKGEGGDDYSLFDSSERFASFMDALRSDSHLERLDLSCFDVREEGIFDALAAALLEIEGLAHLGLYIQTKATSVNF
jgi:hypothetical protein